MEYIFSISSRSDVSFALEISQMNFDLIFWCVYSHIYFVSSVSSVTHAECERISVVV